MAYFATNIFPADGVRTEWDFYFAGVSPDSGSGTLPYLFPEDVKAAELYRDANGSPAAAERLVQLVAPNRARIVGAPVAAGRQIKIYRQTEIRFPLVDYRDGQSVSDVDLDLANRQAIFVAQETNDAASNNIQLDAHDNFDAKDRRIVRLADGIDPTDAVNLRQLDRTLRVPVGETVTQLPAAAQRANRILGFDPQGNPEAFIPAPGTALALAMSLRNTASAVEGDNMVGHYEPTSPTVRTVNQKFQQIDSLLGTGFADLGLTPEQYGAKGDNVADDTVAIQAWISALILTGNRGRCRAGAVYRISATVAAVLGQGQRLSFDMQGARFFQTGNNVVLNASNTLNGADTDVINLENVGYALGNGGTQTRVMKITSVGHPFTAPGQIGRIYSDDIVPDPDGANQMCAEYFVVGAVIDANQFVTSGLFDERYASTPRVCRPSNAQLHITNFAGESVQDDVRNASFLNITGFISPVLDGVMRANNLNGVFLNLTACCRATVEAVKGRDLKNRPDQGAFGYLVNDSGSWYSQIKGIDAVRVRHAYTTSTPTSAVAGDRKWQLRGRTIGSDVIGGRGQGCANAFDTHSPALRIRFIDCTPVDDYRGYDTGGAGIQIRANDCSVINCDVTNSKFGLAMSGASKTTNARLTVRGLRYSGGEGHSPVRISGNPNPALKTVVQFHDGDITTYGAEAFDVINATLNIRDTDVRMVPAANGAAMVTLREGANVTVNGGSLEWLDGNSHAVVAHTATDTTSFVDKLSIIGVTGRLAYLATSASQFNIVSRFTNIQLDAALPGVPFLGTVLAPAAPAVSAQFVVGYSARPLGYRQQVYSTAGGKQIDLQFAGDAHIYLRLEVTVDGVQLTGLTQGAFPGQQLTISSRDTATFNLVVQTSSAGKLQLGSGAVLRPGEGLSLSWDGASWRSGNQHRS